MPHPCHTAYERAIVRPVPKDRPPVPRALIVAFVIAISGIALGPWLDSHRLFLGPYFVVWGAAWFAAARSIVHDEAYLRYTSEVRSRLPWYRYRVDFVERDVRFQRRMLTWLFEPAGVCLCLVGLIMFAGHLIGRTT